VLVEEACISPLKSKKCRLDPSTEKEKKRVRSLFFPRAAFPVERENSERKRGKHFSHQNSAELS
jgi:hypothetical protein